MRRLLLTHDSAAGDGASRDPITESTPKPTPAGTPAAETVIAATVTEETELLREKLEATEAAKKKVESDHASVSDEFKRYKDATEARQQPAPVPVRKKPPEEKPFRIGRFV